MYFFLQSTLKVKNYSNLYTHKTHFLDFSEVDNDIFIIFGVMWFSGRCAAINNSAVDSVCEHIYRKRIQTIK